MLSKSGLPFFESCLKTKKMLFSEISQLNVPVFFGSGKGMCKNFLHWFDGRPWAKV